MESQVLKIAPLQTNSCQVKIKPLTFQIPLANSHQ